MASPNLVTITTVVTPAVSYDLTTLLNVKGELGKADTSDDVVLKRFISSASSAIAAYCNRVFVKETISDAFWPPRDPYPWVLVGGVQPLQLSRWPVIGSPTVTEDAVALTQNTDFKLDPVNGHLHRLDVNSYPRRWPSFAITVQYDAGYVTVPGDIVDAATRMVKARWFARQRDPYLRQENVTGVYEAQYWVTTGSDGGNMPPDIIDLLDNYRTPVTA